MVTSQKENERKDSEKICANGLESVYNVIATEKQPNKKTSEIKSIMGQIVLEFKYEKTFVYVYTEENSCMGNPKFIENIKLKSLTELHFEKGKTMSNRTSAVRILLRRVE